MFIVAQNEVSIVLTVQEAQAKRDEAHARYLTSRDRSDYRAYTQAADQWSRLASRERVANLIAKCSAR